MEYLNNFIITLVATMIFMTSIEIIAPDNSMKKYIKFVLGLILISVMINPIIKFFTGGEQEVINRIKRYEDMLNLGVTNEGESKEVIEKQKEAFKSNLNSNCDNLLKEKFSDKNFKSDIKCNINLSDMTYSIDSLEVGVRENGIRLVDKIRININDESEEAVSNNEKIDNEEEIKNYLSELFKIPIEKIKLYSMGG
ncbi:stage III sporulation protein AF [uncultured Clostridium sp.]|uniref:stage III sporulation protein AF n=1 Tax=uncultured Clostridium sp. TaxID=59620 RepID=UPI0025E42334|nr:stage III sporulation protein AF [uncultured Clostridium sp.]